MNVKQLIIDKYGTINRFVDENYTQMNISRGHLYRLINHTEVVNPTVGTLKKLAELLQIPEEVVIHEYFAGYRNTGTED